VKRVISSEASSAAKSSCASKLVLAHAVHQAKANGLGSLAFDPSHVRHHLVEVGVGVVVVRVHHGSAPGRSKRLGVVHKQARFLGEKSLDAHNSPLRAGRATHQRADDLVAGRNLLKVGVGHGQPSCHRAAVI
jgi:hypothetical protein